MHPNFKSWENSILGNTVMYGATGGKLFAAGRAGERFCVRNSGATAVVEGVGDHGCEYMTGGRVIVLGPTGRNFAAGMSGGVAFVYDPNDVFAARVNYDLVTIEGLDDEDAAFLHDRVRLHVEHTGSAVGREILDSWPVSLADFRKVMPRDYRRVLDALAAASAEGLGETEAMERVMELSRG